ncbi:hypothetical protein EC957_000286 [Mortierella hygrophila]|uniref:Uncharacterized protein n=1 Tax=Mortierella hygrophila TaxID=979708 RepID=A0A9P6F7Z4_9FUNG|nr:hypothetical protein EC957_000286 [Mortierella hygrophila]
MCDPPNSLIKQDRENLANLTRGIAQANPDNYARRANDATNLARMVRMLKDMMNPADFGLLGPCRITVRSTAPLAPLVHSTQMSPRRPRWLSSTTRTPGLYCRSSSTQWPAGYPAAYDFQPACTSDSRHRSGCPDSHEAAPRSEEE